MPKLTPLDRIYETCVVAGTGDYTPLLGAPVGYQPWSGLGAASFAPGFATDGTAWEVGIYTYQSGPSRLQRTAILASSNGGSAVNWGGSNTINIRCDLPAALALPRRLSKSVAGNTDVTLTLDEAFRFVLEFTGALTGSINVIVPTTEWPWTILNNTSGAFKLTVKTAAGTGVPVAQGKYASVYCDGTNVVSSVNETVVAGVAKNLSAKNNAGTPNTKIDIAADSLALEDASGNSLIAKSVALTIDFTTVGANGIDAGAQGASTWYYGWVIGKPDGTIAGLGSLSSSAPTMPAGYTFKALVTAPRSDGATHFIKYRQAGNKVYLEAAQSAVSAGAAVVETAVSLSTLIPPIAEAVQIGIDGTVTASGALPGVNTSVVRIVSGSNIMQFNTQAAVSQAAYNSSSCWLPNVAQNLYYINAVTNAPAVATTGVNVLGFQLPCGGE